MGEGPGAYYGMHVSMYVCIYICTHTLGIIKGGVMLQITPTRILCLGTVKLLAAQPSFTGQARVFHETPFHSKVRSTFWLLPLALQ